MTASLKPSSVLDMDEGSRSFSTLLVAGAPLVLGAIFGISQVFHVDRFGGEESSGLLLPCLVLGLLIGVIVGVLVARRMRGGTLAAAIELEGAAKVIVAVTTIAAMALIPAALTSYGALVWFNGFALGEERTVECDILSSYGKTRKGTYLGWHVAYACDVDGEHLTGSFLARREPPARVGATVRLAVVKGRLGRWLRESEPLDASGKSAD